MTDESDRGTTNAIDDALQQARDPASRQQVYLVVVEGQKTGAVYRVGELETGPGAESDEGDLVGEKVDEEQAKLIRQGAELHEMDMGGVAGGMAEGDRFQLGGGALLKVYFGQGPAETLRRGLYESLVRDWLTGLHTRRFFEERLTAEFSFAVRHNSPLSFILLDVDGLREITDQRGRKAGDDARRAVAAALRDATRTEDVVARFGGDEFAVLARQTTSDQAVVLAERIHDLVEAAEIPGGAAPTKVTLRAGLATFNPLAFDSAVDLVEAANRALVRAKRDAQTSIITATENDVRPFAD